MTFRSCGSERWIIVCDENWFMRKAKNNKTYAGWLTFITLASDAEQQNVFYKVKLFSQKRLICSYLQTLTELLLYPQFQHFSHVAYLRLGIGTLFHSVPRCSTISFCLTSLFSPSFFLGPGTIFSVFALGEKATCQNQETERPPNFQGCGRSRTQIEFSLIWFSYKTKGNKQSRDFETDYLCLIFCSSQSQTRKPNASTLSRPCYDCCSTTDSPEWPSPRKAKNQSILDDGFRFFISMRGEMVRAPLSSSLRNERARTFPEFQNHFGARMQTVTTVSCLSCSNTGCSPQTWDLRAHFVAEIATLSRNLNGKCGPEILMRHSRHFRKPREWF